jgi:hypothetical protein
LTMNLHCKPGIMVIDGMVDCAKPGSRSGMVDLASKFPWRRIWAGLCLALGIAAAVLLAIWTHPGAKAHHMLARINGPMPPIEVEASGAATNLKQLVSGAKHVVVFYSLSCGICREVLPALQPFPSALRLIMISESIPRTNSEMSKFHEADFFYDRWNMLARLFIVSPLPVILLVDEGGIIRDGFVGFHERDWIQQRLNQFAGGHYGLAEE